MMATGARKVLTLFHELRDQLSCNDLTLGKGEQSIALQAGECTWT
jgi:hypothetical protein